MPDFVRLDHVHPESGRTFLVNWCVTSVCNYRCSYCLPTLHDSRHHFPTVATVLTTFRQIQEQRPNHRIGFEFTGGEVALWPHFLDCAGELKRAGARTTILSNGSRPLSWWEKATPLLDNVVLSFHSEFAPFDHFLEVVTLLSKRVSLHVNVIMHPRLFDQCLAASRILRRLDGFTLALQPVLVDLGAQDSKMVSYTSDQLDVIQNPRRYLREPSANQSGHGHQFRGPIYLEDATGQRFVRTPQEMLASKHNRWRGWTCSMGLQQVAIELDGSIYGGFCRQGSQLGNVHERRIALPTEPVVCRKDSCSCFFDVQCTKERTALR